MFVIIEKTYNINSDSDKIPFIVSGPFSLGAISLTI